MNNVTTVAAREKFAKAHIGVETLPAITQVGWGDGGHDVNGNAIPPTGNETIVPGEFLKKNINSHSFPVPTTLQIFVALSEEEANGKNISACGLYDADGTLVALKTFKPKAKDNETEIELYWDEEF